MFGEERSNPCAIAKPADPRRFARVAADGPGS